MKDSDFNFLRNEIKKISKKVLRNIIKFERDEFPNLKQVLSRKSGLYFILEKNEIIYVGRALNLFERLGNHINGAAKTVRTKHKEIKGRNVSFGYVLLPRDIYFIIESDLINNLQKKVLNTRTN